MMKIILKIPFSFLVLGFTKTKNFKPFHQKKYFLYFFKSQLNIKIYDIQDTVYIIGIFPLIHIEKFKYNQLSLLPKTFISNKVFNINSKFVIPKNDSKIKEVPSLELRNNELNLINLKFKIINYEYREHGT